MTAYLIATCRDVEDRAAFDEYVSLARPTLAGYDAKALSFYTPFTILEGNLPLLGVVIIEFATMEIAKEWYNSPAYQAAIDKRRGLVDFEFVLVESGAVKSRDIMPEVKGRKAG